MVFFRRIRSTETAAIERDSLVLQTSLERSCIAIEDTEKLTEKLTKKHKEESRQPNSSVPLCEFLCVLCGYTRSKRRETCKRARANDFATPRPRLSQANLRYLGCHSLPRWKHLRSHRVVPQRAVRMDGRCERDAQRRASRDVWRRKKRRTRGITAHLDTLGAVVKAFTSTGRVHLQKLGNYSWNSLENEEVQLFASNGKTYKGSVIVANASHHLHDSKEGNAVVPRDENTVEVRLDAPASSEAELRALGIDIGDYVAFEPRTSWNYGYVRSRFLDDKALVACLFCALKTTRDAGLPFAQRTTVFLPNYEEVGHGGRSGWPSDLAEMVALDVSPVGQGQQSRETHCSLCVADADGPYDFHLCRKLRRLAREAGVELLPDVFIQYASDAGAARASGLDARFALIGPGVDATHDIERTHMDALEATTKMVVAYLTT